MFLKPSFLKKGDTVLIIATARARNELAVKPAVNILASWGLNVECGKHTFKTHHQFAGTDAERAEDLQWALDHPKAKAILLSGGGYGSMRIIDKVTLEKFKEFPKWLIGYSDTTVLHARLLNHHFQCIHGTMAFQFEKDVDATNSVKDLLFGTPISYEIPQHSLNRNGKVEAVMIGGNLSLLYALSGSIDDLETKDKILFIEDLDEQLYHIDRIMLQLKRSGKLSQLAGLVVGGMSDMKDNAIPYGQTAEEIIWDAVKEFKYPVCFNFPAGHIQKNMALYLGANVCLNVQNKQAELSYINHQ
jgi:muramoyltetrapeptide carboxypeptidase